MKALFVAGTDTAVGKTVVCGLLARYLSEKGYKVVTQKWVETGCKKNRDRHHLFYRKNGVCPYFSYLSQAPVYSFKFAASPHLASRLEGRTIDIAKIKKSFKRLAGEFDFVIVEGTGGSLVPLSRKKVILDVTRELDLPVLIVAGNKLGAINHTLLTVEALKARSMKILGIIFNNLHKNENALILKDNPKIVKALTGERMLGDLPRRKGRCRLYREFVPIGNRIFKELKREP